MNEIKGRSQSDSFFLGMIFIHRFNFLNPLEKSLKPLIYCGVAERKMLF